MSVFVEEWCAWVDGVEIEPGQSSYGHAAGRPGPGGWPENRPPTTAGQYGIEAA